MFVPGIGPAEAGTGAAAARAGAETGAARIGPEAEAETGGSVAAVGVDSDCTVGLPLGGGGLGLLVDDDPARAKQLIHKPIVVDM